MSLPRTAVALLSLALAVAASDLGAQSGRFPLSRVRSEVRDAIARGELLAVRSATNADSLSKQADAIRLQRGEVVFLPGTLDRTPGDSVAAVAAAGDSAATNLAIPVLIGVPDAQSGQIVLAQPELIVAPLRYRRDEDRFTARLRISLRTPADQADALPSNVQITLIAPDDSVDPGIVELGTASRAFAEVTLRATQPTDSVRLMLRVANNPVASVDAMVPVRPAAKFSTSARALRGYGTEAIELTVHVVGTTNLAGHFVSLAGSGHIQPKSQQTDDAGTATFIYRSDRVGADSVQVLIAGSTTDVLALSVEPPTNAVFWVLGGLGIAVLVAYSRSKPGERVRHIGLAIGCGILAVIAPVGLGVHLIALPIPPFVTSLLGLAALAAIGGSAPEAVLAGMDAFRNRKT